MVSYDMICINIYIYIHVYSVHHFYASIPKTPSLTIPWETPGLLILGNEHDVVLSPEPRPQESNVFAESKLATCFPGRNLSQQGNMASQDIRNCDRKWPTQPLTNRNLCLGLQSLQIHFAHESFSANFAASEN